MRSNPWRLRGGPGHGAAAGSAGARAAHGVGWCAVRHHDREYGGTGARRVDQRVVGDRFVMALERLMGLVLVTLWIEMMLRGIKAFIKQVAGA